MKATLFSRQAAKILWVAGRLGRGFSQKTCLPALAAAIEISSLTEVGVAT